MSKFNKKGYRNGLQIGSPLYNILEHRVNKNMKARQVEVRAAKARLREMKKRVPLADRAKVDWTRVPEEWMKDDTI